MMECQGSQLSVLLWRWRGVKQIVGCADGQGRGEERRQGRGPGVLWDHDQQRPRSRRDA